jgi:hypothetical protein
MGDGRRLLEPLVVGARNKCAHAWHMCKIWGELLFAASFAALVALSWQLATATAQVSPVELASSLARSFSKALCAGSALGGGLGGVAFGMGLDLTSDERIL